MIRRRKSQFFQTTLHVCCWTLSGSTSYILSALLLDISAITQQNRSRTFARACSLSSGCLMLHHVYSPLPVVRTSWIPLAAQSHVFHRRSSTLSLKGHSLFAAIPIGPTLLSALNFQETPLLAQVDVSCFLSIAKGDQHRYLSAKQSSLSQLPTTRSAR